MKTCEHHLQSILTTPPNAEDARLQHASAQGIFPHDMTTADWNVISEFIRSSFCANFYVDMSNVRLLIAKRLLQHSIDAQSNSEQAVGADYLCIDT